MSAQSRTPADDPADRPIVVLGLMGAGKTTVATAVARALGRPLRDSDADIEAEQGCTAAQIVQRDGKDALHEIEADHLLAQLGQGVVVAAAASTVDVARCVDALTHKATVVWLDGSPELLAERFDSPDGHRPQFAASVLQMLRDQAASRNPMFERVADLRIDVSQPPDAVVSSVLAGLATLTETRRAH